MVQGRLSPRQLIQIQTCLCTPLQQFSALRLDSDCCDQQQKEDTVPRPGPPCHAGTGPRHWRHCSARHGLSRCAALHLLVLAIRLSPDIVDDVPARRFRLFFFGPCGPCSITPECTGPKIRPVSPNSSCRGTRRRAVQCALLDLQAQAKKPWRAKQAIILCVCCCLGPRQTKGARRPKLRRGLRGCPASKAATRLLLVILTASSILHVGPYVHFWAQNEVGGRRARPPARHRGRRVNRRRSQPGHPQRPLCAGRRHPPGLREALHGPGQRRSG